MTAAVWIRPEDTAAWLVEVLPGLPDDPDVLRPVVFTASADFRYPLYLIAGRLDSLLNALPRDTELAAAISRGQVLYGSEDAQVLLREASRVVGRT